MIATEMNDLVAAMKLAFKDAMVAANKPFMTKEDIAKEFGVSESTLYRYRLPQSHHFVNQDGEGKSKGFYKRKEVYAALVKGTSNV